MSFTNWSDYHAWHLSDELMHSARLRLSPAASNALIMAAEDDAGGHLVPREAIEDAALAMTQADAAHFLASVYGLSLADGARLLRTIRMVRA